MADRLTPKAAQLASKNALPDTFGAFDGRERQCLEHVLKTAERNPAAVIKAIDEFAYATKWMMNIGDVKGVILETCLDRTKPGLVLELGAYVGYSSLKMIQRLPEASKIVSVEISSRAAEVARAMIAHAGMSSRITIVHGYLQDAGETCRRLESEHGIKPETLDFVFIDHAKEAYLPDLKVILARRWLKPGATVFADNVLFPGAPDYKQFMEENEGKLFNTRMTETMLEYQDKIPDLVLESRYLAARTRDATL